MGDESPHPQRTPRQPEPVRFDDPRQERLHELLARIGDGPASMYRDMLRLMSGDEFVENAASVLIHFARELKSSIKDVLLPADFTKPDENGDAAAVDAIMANLGLPPDHVIGTTWKKFKPHEIVHRRSLGGPLRLVEVQAAAAEFERMLEMLLDEMQRSYAVVYHKLDSVLAKVKPGRKDVSKVLKEVPQNAQALGYFYNSASVERWIEPLHKCKVFADPPSYASWPAMHFLKRAAESHSARVAEILASIAIPENPMNQMQYLEVIEALPIQLRPSLLLPFVKERKGYDDFVVRDLVDAVAAIAPIEPDTALAITTSLLQLHVVSKQTGSLREIEARFDVHTYGDVVSDAVPVIVSRLPAAAVQAFVGLLDDAFTQAYDRDDESDLSVSWRASMAPHEQNRFFKPVEYLGDAVIAAAEAAVRAEPAKLDELATDLWSREWTFFRRLALHLLTVFGDPTTRTVQDAVLSRDNLQQCDLRREYHLLIAKVVPELSPEVKQVLIHQILEGPDDAKRLEDDPEYATYYRDKWIKDRLAWIGDALPADVRAQYEEMVARLGPCDETDDFFGFITEWQGPQSPISGDDLIGMEIGDIVSYLRDWQPQTTRFVPTREGLGRVLQSAARARAREMSAAAMDFIGLDATYVRSIVTGLEQALTDGQAIAWDEVLKVCEWAVAQPRDIPGREHRGLDNDPHWGWTRSAVASLFQTGFLKEDGLAPDHAMRQRIWAVLEVVMADPDPHEKRDEQLRDPTSTAINSTRGRALEAVMRYILWLRGGVARPHGVDHFEDMPEVRTLLDQHLDRNVDQSPAIRAVYGQWLFYLDRLAPAWLESKIAQVFPVDDPELEDAALDAYVLYGKYTSDRMTELLDAVFRRAIPRLGRVEAQNRTEREAPRRLGQQFVLAYLAGKDSFEGGSLLSMYFDAADVESRADALAFAVHQLKEPGDDIDVVRERLIALWEWRAASGVAGELAAFGRWIGEEQLDPAWRLDKLEEALKRARGLDSHYAVMPALAKLAMTHPAAVLRGVKLAIETAARSRLYSYVHDGDLRRVLEAAFATGNCLVQVEAKAIANILVAYDFLDFRDLAERDVMPPDPGFGG